MRNSTSYALIVSLFVILSGIVLFNHVQAQEPNLTAPIEPGLGWHDVTPEAAKCLKDLSTAFTSVCKLVGDGKELTLKPNPCDDKLEPVKVLCSVDVRAIIGRETDPNRNWTPLYRPQLNFQPDEL